MGFEGIIRMLPLMADFTDPTEGKMTNETLIRHKHTCPDCGQEWLCTKTRCSRDTLCSECTEKEYKALEKRLRSSSDSIKGRLGKLFEGRPASKKPVVASTVLAWRAECVKGYMKRFKWDLISQRLTSALYKGRINPMEHERLEKLLEASWEDVEQAPPLSDFSESDRYLLWQARILQRVPNGSYRWFAAWGFLGLTVFVAVTLLLSLTRLSLPELVMFGEKQSSEGILCFAITIIVVRMIYNKRYKGDWLPDDALACVKVMYLVFFVPSCVYFALSTLGELAVLLDAAITLGVLVGSLVLLQCILLLFGRPPYTEVDYPLPDWR